MNALNSLFDFAALMSTSSAMSLIPDSHDSNESAQDTKRSEACSATTAPAQYCQVLGRTQHLPQQVDGSLHSLPHTESPIATFSRAHVDSGNQYPVDWVPALPLSQDISVQGQYSLMPEHSRFSGYGVPAFDCCNILRNHHSSQRCDCKYSNPLPTHYLQGTMVQNARNAQHVLREQSWPELQRFQQPQAVMLSREGHVPGQPLPLHSSCIENSHEPVTPQSVALQYSVPDMGIHPEGTMGNVGPFMQYY